jgi:hypothetical protein
VVIGQALDAGQVLGDGDAVMVAIGETRFLVVDGRRLNITEAVAHPALGLTAPAVEVLDQILNTVPAGPDLEVFPIEDAGDRLTNREVAGERPIVGTVYQDENDSYYVMTVDGLVRVGEVYARLRLADEDSQPDQDRPREISSPEVAQHLVIGRVLEPEGYPTRIPVLLNEQVGPEAVFCTTFSGSPPNSSISISLYSEVPPRLSAGGPDVVGLRPTGRDGDGLATEAVIAGGQGAIVQAVPAPGAPQTGTTVYLVTDQGIKYPLGTGDVDALSALGYGGIVPTGVPADILALLPTGPTLSGSAARQTAVNVAAQSAPLRSPSVVSIH